MDLELVEDGHRPEEEGLRRTEHGDGVRTGRWLIGNSQMQCLLLFSTRAQYQGL